MSNITLGLKNMPFITLKMDSTYGDQRVRWNPVDDNIYRLCFEHSCLANLEFDSIEDIENISKLGHDDKIHIPKELFVLGIPSLCEKSVFMPAIIWPTCSHKNEDLQKDIISEIHHHHHHSFNVSVPLFRDSSSSSFV